MTNHLALDSRDLALELYTFLREIDPARWRDDVDASARRNLAAIEARVTGLLDHTWTTGETVRARLIELQRVVRDGAPSAEDVQSDLRAQWMRLRSELQAAYEAFAASLREWDIHVPSLRPTNYARSALHVATGLLVLGLVYAVLTTPTAMRLTAFTFAALGWTFEVTRRFNPRWNEVLMAAFGPTSHPHERHRVNSATWYVTALAALSLTASLPAIYAAVAVLGLGDPMAALVGRRWGRVKLLHGRTLEGSLAFVVAGTLAAFAALAFLQGLLPVHAALIAACAATAGALAELLVRRVDDNFAIPLAAGLVAWLLATLVGVG